MKKIYTLVFVAAALVACSKKKEEAAAPPPATGSAIGSAGSAEGSGTADTGSAGSAAAVAAEEPVDVPTEVDFETEATAGITDKNVETKVKELETELSE